MYEHTARQLHFSFHYQLQDDHLKNLGLAPSVITYSWLIQTLCLCGICAASTVIKLSDLVIVGLTTLKFLFEVCDINLLFFLQTDAAGQEGS